MAGNTFGTLFKVTTFGESHGVALGCVIDGCPAGLTIDEDFLQNQLDRRRPGATVLGDGTYIHNAAVTSRNEMDKAEIVSGVFEGKTTGTPLTIIIRNTSQKSSDYNALKDVFRPGHADYSYFAKYGFRDYRGGGRSSGRETAARVASGAIARLFLKTHGISVTAYTLRAAGVSCAKISFEDIEKNPLRAADCDAAKEMLSRIETLRKEGNSAGGIIECVIHGVPAGLGEPVFEKLDAKLAQAMMSIGAVKGIEFGDGFAAADITGKENNDALQNKDGTIQFTSNHAGGILGGISTGSDIVFRLAIKPVPSIFLPQETVRTSGEPCSITIQGRHDVCLCPRIVPVVEAMAALVLADMLLQNRSART